MKVFQRAKRSYIAEKAPGTWRPCTSVIGEVGDGTRREVRTATIVCPWCHRIVVVRHETITEDGTIDPFKCPYPGCAYSPRTVALDGWSEYWKERSEP